MKSQIKCILGKIKKSFIFYTCKIKCDIFLFFEDQSKTFRQLME